MDLRKPLILTLILLFILVPVGALKIDTSNDSSRAISSVKTVQNNFNITVHANEQYVGKFSSKNGKINTTKPKHGQLSLNKKGEYIYKPYKNFVGQDTFQYKFFNGKSYSEIFTVTITVTNNIPVTKNISVKTHVNVQYNGKLTGVDKDNDVLTYNLISNATNGKIKLNGNGVYSYTPNTNFTGVDSFSYRVNDGINNSEVSTVTLNITNNPPVANSFNTELHANSEYYGKLNGTDIDGDNLTYIISQPTNGVLHLDHNGFFTYTPNNDFVGVDSFNYIVNDGCNDSKNGTVTLNVNNCPAIANNMKLKLSANIPYTGKLNGTDSDHDILTYYSVVNPSNGILKLDPDGNFVYTPNDGFIGTDNFSYIVSDGLSYSDIANVSLDVVNNHPSAYNLNISTMGNTPYNGKLNVTDTDPDEIYYHCINYPSNGTLTTNPDGTFRYIPNKGFVGVDSFIFIVNDGTDYSNVAKVTINVIDNPPVAHDMNIKITFETFDYGHFSNKLNGSDFDGHPLTYTLLTKPYFATDVIVNGDYFQYISGARYTGVDKFTYKANDGYLDSNTGTVNIEASVW